MLNISELPAIDVHGHYGRYLEPDRHKLRQEFMTADGATIVARAKAAHIQYTVVSPFLGIVPRGHGDAVAGNEEARRVVEENDGLLQWVVLHPGQPATIEQVRRMLKWPKCVGIKIHPEEHRYEIVERGGEIFKLAAEFHAVILTHSGEPNSMPADFVPLADEFPEVTLILAHLGYHATPANSPEPQVRAIQASRHGNIYADTSSAQSLMPGLIEWAVGEAGAERILFGTDTPCYFTACQRARIDYAELSDAQKSLILSENARRILAIP
jgi:uncharacterized protein